MGMLETFIKAIFGSRNDRVIKSFKPLVQRVNELEPDLKKLNDQQLRDKTAEFKHRLERGETLDEIQPEAFAVVREASIRTLHMRHFDVQVIGGAVLHKGMIAEMKTGEGKTLVATLPVYLNALTGKGVHVVTVNDYLARRDTEWMGQIYRFLGLSVGVIYSGIDEAVKRKAYLSDITYGQNNEFGFDYLRDNLRFSAEEMLQHGHNYAIVDEVDSILIDEARTPLIISGPAEDSTDQYIKINRIIPRLVKGEDFEIDLRSKQPTLTEAGVAKSEKLLQIDNLYDPKNIETLHHVNQALRAHTTMERDVDYVVRNGEIMIVDEFTGRLMPGRRWSNGLHQAIEAKENVTVRRENQTLASITFQNLFRMYDKLAGMTGTALTEAPEFRQIYNLGVIVIPTHRPMIRKDLTDVVFRSRNEKYQAVCDDIEEIHKTGQPVLVGTISIEQSEALARELKKKEVAHNVLNAKHHEREAEIIAQAGRLNAVTISTNMAGRGTDIMLGGNPEFLAQAETGLKDSSDPIYQAALEKYSKICASEKEKVIEAGGLYILGTERHEARRIDNQLRGRAGRQGDPGNSRFYVSLEDDLMVRFGGDKIQNIMSKLGWEEGVAMDGRMISRSIESAQQRVERFHFDSRKHVTEYDDVMNKQRQVIYNLRGRVISNENIREELYVMIDDLLEDAIVSSCPERSKPEEWDIEALKERYLFLFNLPADLPEGILHDHQQLFDHLRQESKQSYDKHVSRLSDKLQALEELTFSDGTKVGLQISRTADKPFEFSTIEQDTVLETLDYYWNQHLQEMDHLREGIGLRGYGQLNPLYEYQKEGFTLFQSMLAILRETVIRKLFYYEVPEPKELLEQLEAEQKRRAAIEQQMRMVHDSPDGEAASERGVSVKPEPKDLDAEKARRLAQKRARRKNRR